MNQYKQLRQAAELTQPEAAKLTGWSERSIRNLENEEGYADRVPVNRLNKYVEDLRG